MQHDIGRHNAAICFHACAAGYIRDEHFVMQFPRDAFVLVSGGEAKERCLRMDASVMRDTFVTAASCGFAAVTRGSVPARRCAVFVV
jgi:hypothetical protein